MQTTQTVQCDVPGFEAVEVEYSLMATANQIAAFQSSMGRDNLADVVVKVSPPPSEVAYSKLSEETLATVISSRSRSPQVSKTLLWPSALR